MFDTVSIDMANMEAIEAMYIAAAGIIDGIIGDLAEAKETLDLHHEGIATEIYAACFERYAEHMDFLRSCCATAEGHVRLTRENFVLADELRNSPWSVYSRGLGRLGTYGA